MTPAQRLMRRVRKRGPRMLDMEDRCWVWTGSRDRKGYGRFKFQRRNARAHRVSYLLFIGSIPSGDTIHHICRNPSCVRPSHLMPMSLVENTIDGNRRRGDDIPI
jgi:hypothetical protein